jgi:hypothetical protein
MLQIPVLVKSLVYVDKSFLKSLQVSTKKSEFEQVERRRGKGRIVHP